MARKTRRPGRPPAGADAAVRERLLDAAAELFGRQGFSATSLRDVATAADVTPAMVAYYFVNKDGLYAALLERALEELLPDATALPGDGPPDPERLAEGLFAIATERYTERPWIPALLVRVVLDEGGAFREAFIERFATRLAGRLVGALDAAKRGGVLRADVDPKLAYASLISLVMFPLIARPILERILGMSLDDASVRRALQDHGRRVFLEGVLARDAS